MAKTELKKDSPEIAQDKLQQFKKLFPEALSEGRVDVDALRRSLGENVAANDERYSLNWAGKTDAFRALQTPTTATLAPCPEESVDFDKTGNIFIEGENLEVLKVLQKSYYSKIKMIYIDPPYNTGSDSFIYPDRFQESKEDYLKRIEEKDEAGYLLKEGLFRKNSKENGHYHSNWLSMMYPRLFLARNLLKDDGVIFVSIDDNEVHNLRLLMNEVFGEENFVANVVWQRKRGRDNSAKWFSKSHEYLLIYSKNKDCFETNFLELDERTKKAYTNPDNDPRGIYRMLAVWARGTQGGCEYEFIDKNGKKFKTREWLMSKENLVKLDNENKLIVHGDNIYRKLFIDENKGKIPETIWDNVSNAANAADEIKKIFGKIIFDTPKPIPYIQEALKISTQSSDLILDFFAGSCTTAAAVLELNKVDGGHRKFVCVQLPEKIDENTEAFKVGYKTISEIGKERIRRVIKKVKEDIEKKSTMDLGFKVLKLKNSNFKIWRGDVIDTAEDLEKQMDLLKDPVKPEALEQNLLWELMLKSGYDLNTPIEEKKMEGSHFYLIADGELVIVLGKTDEKCLREIVKLKPQNVVCLDSIFEGNDQLKTNTVLQMKDAGIAFKTV